MVANGNGEVEVGKTYEMVESQETPNDKPSPDMTWVNVNYKAGAKNILTNCWGNVSLNKFDTWCDYFLQGDEFNNIILC